MIVRARGRLSLQRFTSLRRQLADTNGHHLPAYLDGHYGHLQRAYMWQLVEERRFDRIKVLVEAFVAEVSPVGADGQVRGAAARSGSLRPAGRQRNAAVSSRGPRDR